MADEPLPIPHRCGAVVGYCIVRLGYKILYCDICKHVIGWEKDGLRFIRTFEEHKYKKKQYSEETINDSV